MADRSNQRFGFLAVDLVVVGSLGLWMVVSGAVGGSNVINKLVGWPAVLFAPGYAIVAILFPRRRLPGPRDGRQVSPVERGVLAIGASVCLVPLIGVVLLFVDTLQRSAFLASIGGLVLALTLIAAIRRQRVPRRERFGTGLLSTIVDATGTIRTASWVPVLVIIGLVVAGGGIGVAALTTESGESFTEFYLVSESDGGEAVAGEYPRNITVSGSEQVGIGITNKEGTETTYTIVVLSQQVENGEVTQYRRLDSIGVTVPQNTTVQRSHNVSPELSNAIQPGDDVRLMYLLYKGNAQSASELSTETAYRHVHIWAEFTE